MDNFIKLKLGIVIVAEPICYSCGLQTDVFLRNYLQQFHTHGKQTTFSLRIIIYEKSELELPKQLLLIYLDFGKLDL